MYKVMKFDKWSILEKKKVSTVTDHGMDHQGSILAGTGYFVMLPAPKSAPKLTRSLTKCELGMKLTTTYIFRRG